MDEVPSFREHSDTWKKMKERLDAAVVHTTRVAEMVKANQAMGATSAENVPEVMTDMLGWASDLAKLSLHADARAKALTEMRRMAADQQNNEAVQRPPLGDVYNTQVANFSLTPQQIETKIASHRQIQKLQKLANPSTGDDDEEIVFETQGGGNVATKCPCTGGPMKDPLRSQDCGHTFSEEGIMNHIRVSNQIPQRDNISPNKTAKCPVAGCPKLVSTSLLEEDIETQIALRDLAHRVATQANRDAEMGEDIDAIDDL